MAIANPIVRAINMDDCLDDCLTDLLGSNVLSKCVCYSCKGLSLSKTYHLTGTPYVLYANRKSPIWWWKINYKYNTTNDCSYTIGRKVSFQEMFEEISEDIKCKLLFHLDVFAKD